MRRILPALLVLGAFAASPALAQKHCVAPADQAAFEVQALRTHLRVLAIHCADEARWASFVGKYQADLSANDKAVTAWFKRRFGGRAQPESDKFVTDLANAISTGNTALGGDLCPHNGQMFVEAMALRSGADLAPYAAAKDVVPASVEICPGEKAPVAKPVAKPAAKR
ncbi:MAG: hypothetical protein WCI94_21850 [Rhodospirillales bacterium]